MSVRMLSSNHPLCVRPCVRAYAVYTTQKSIHTQRTGPKQTYVTHTYYYSRILTHTPPKTQTFHTQTRTNAALPRGAETSGVVESSAALSPLAHHVFTETTNRMGRNRVGISTTTGECDVKGTASLIGCCLCHHCTVCASVICERSDINREFTICVSFFVLISPKYKTVGLQLSQKIWVALRGSPAWGYPSLCAFTLG